MHVIFEKIVEINKCIPHILTCIKNREMVIYRYYLQKYRPMQG